MSSQDLKTSLGHSQVNWCAPMESSWAHQGLFHGSCLSLSSNKKEDNLVSPPFRPQAKILTCSARHQRLFPKLFESKGREGSN